MIIALEGIPGAGKTTATEYLKTYYEDLGVKIKVFHEKFDDSILQLFLNNPVKYGMAFQMHILFLRKEIHLKALKYHDAGYYVIIDRSVFGDMAFCNLHVKNGNIDNDTYADYLNIIDNIPRLGDLNVFFLDVSIECAKSRIRNRSRLNEHDVYTDKYLSDLRSCHIEVFKDRNVKIIDWESDLSSIHQSLSKITGGIK